MNLCQTEVTGQTLSNNSIDVLCFSSHDLKVLYILEYKKLSKSLLDLSDVRDKYLRN